MTTTSSWSRPHFVRGGEGDSGGNPLLFFAVLGTFDTSTPLSASKYASKGAPPGIEVMTQDEPQVLARLRSGWAWDQFTHAQPDVAKRVTTAPMAFLLRGSPRDQRSLEYLRDAIGLLTYLVDCGGLAVNDPQTLRWYSANQWREQIFGNDDPNAHATILVSPDENAPGRSWFHTRGMRKFGRPDLSVHGVTDNMREGVADFCERMVQHQALGAVIPDGMPVKMAMLPPGGKLYRAGHLEDPDFNNEHLELRW